MAVNTAEAHHLPGTPAALDTVGGRGASRGGDQRGDAHEAIAALLSTGLSRLDLWVTQAEASEALTLLEGLAPLGFRGTVDALSREGLLAAMLGALDFTGREEFLTLAAAGGYLQRDSGRPVSAPLDPPAHPSLFRQDRALPREVNDAIHENSRSAAVAYTRAYQAYLDRYVGAVEACRSGRELRGLGEFEHPALLMPLVDVKDPLAARYGADWPTLAPSAFAAQRAVSDRVTRFLGESRPGSVWAEASVALRAGPLAADLSADSRGDGPVVDGRLSVVRQLGPWAQVAKRSDGSTAFAAQTSVGGRETGVAVDCAGGEVQKVSVALSGLGVSASRHEVGVKMGAAYARGDEDQLSGGVERTLSALDGRLALRLSVGFGMQGLSRAQARQALSRRSEGVFGTPAELVAGVRWEALSPAVREYFARNAWSAEEWTERLATRP
jgi:hypothetical protein